MVKTRTKAQAKTLEVSRKLLDRLNINPTPLELPRNSARTVDFQAKANPTLTEEMIQGLIPGRRMWKKTLLPGQLNTFAIWMSS